MGEVYRADDLKLGHAVALKFLPKDLADDPRRLEYFVDEVRLARQISHPNVCRVHDISDVDGQHFLSMEYIDGEDLRGLLRRIGRLPIDKGIDIAQQLCRGLAAAHERGILHRDLKPANIMLDGRGQVRITDFGLARLASDGSHTAEVAGTPAYMAPEQLARGDTSVQSDLYSLGLVLYEIFTGRRVYESSSRDELMRLHEEKPITDPAYLCGRVDPAVEKVILRCLEKDPRDRPRSARGVAAALPGADPLEAALAAGETPSPGMVAAAGGQGEISPTQAAASLAGVAIGLLVVCLLAQRTKIVNRAPMELPPDALEIKAKEIMKRLGYSSPRAYSARGFDDAPADREAVRKAALAQGIADRWDLLKTGPWPGVRFWYRQSPEPMLVQEYFDKWGDYSMGMVGLQVPRWDVPGMTGMSLDPRGKLRWFRAVPPLSRAAHPPHSRDERRPTTGQSRPAHAADPDDPPWSTWLREEELGFILPAANENGGDLRKLSGDELREAGWLLTPRDAYDHLSSWKGTWPGSVEPLHVEAAAYRGRPVYFEVIPSSFVGQSKASSDLGSPEAPTALILAILMNFAVFTGELLLAWWNLRQGKGDRRGASRLSQTFFFISLLAWAFRANHTRVPLEWANFWMGLAQSLETAAVIWLHYIALEPFVRRIWPQTLISWARLLSGRFRDTLVGRDILLGTLLGVLVAILINLGRWAPAWFGLQPGIEPIHPHRTMDTASLIGAVLELQVIAVQLSLFFLTMLLVLRLLFRSLWLAACVFVLVNTALYCLAEPEPTTSTCLCIGLAVALAAWVQVRLGLLSGVVGYCVLMLLQLPMTTDSTAFHFGNGLLVMALVLAIALYGFFTSQAGRPLFREASDRPSWKLTTD
jgi:serine/threonine-protein kinase